MDDFKESPIVPMCYFDLSIPKDRLKKQDIDKILASDFGIYQVELIFEDGAREILCHVGGINKSQELTKVYCDEEYIHIKIEENKKGSN